MTMLALCAAGIIRCVPPVRLVHTLSLREALRALLVPQARAPRAAQRPTTSAWPRVSRAGRALTARAACVPSAPRVSTLRGPPTRRARRVPLELLPQIRPQQGIWQAWQNSATSFLTARRAVPVNMLSPTAHAQPAKLVGTRLEPPTRRAPGVRRENLRAEQRFHFIMKPLIARRAPQELH